MKSEKISKIPDGYHTVTPFIAVKNARKLLDFMKEAFNAETLAIVPNADGSVGHAETKIGDSIVMMFDSKKGWPHTPSFLRLYVDDCDATHQQAVKSGASSVTEPTDMAWGEKVSRVRDPFGNIWWLMERREEVSPEKLQRRFGEKKYIDAMAYVQGADFFPVHQQ